MSDEAFVDVLIIFQNRKDEARYALTVAERDRLIKQFTGGALFGSYEVRWPTRAPAEEKSRRLALRFADVLYIG